MSDTLIPRSLPLPNFVDWQICESPRQLKPTNRAPSKTCQLCSGPSPDRRITTPKDLATLTLSKLEQGFQHEQHRLPFQSPSLKVREGGPRSITAGKGLVGVGIGEDEDSKIYFAFSNGDNAAGGGTAPGGAASKSDAYVDGSMRPWREKDRTETQKGASQKEGRNAWKQRQHLLRGLIDCQIRVQEQANRKSGHAAQRKGCIDGREDIIHPG